MRTMRMLLSVAAGYLAGTIVVMIGFLAVGKAFSLDAGVAPTPLYLAATVAVDIIGAAGGGYVCARLAPPGRLAPSAALLIALFLTLALVSARLSGGTGQTRPYLALVTLLGVIGLWAGVMIERALHGRRRV